jgi:membrane protease subunit HflC
MQKEREREANEYRAEGDETAQRVRARAERERTVLIAEATRESEILRGQGDAEKTRILGEAFGQDPDFFAFYRSMTAYRDALKGDNTTLVLSPDGEFFKYFGSGGNGPKRK